MVLLFNIMCIENELRRGFDALVMFLCLLPLKSVHEFWPDLTTPSAGRWILEGPMWWLPRR